VKVRLLFPDRDADRAAAPPAGADDLVADLDLEPVLRVMAPEHRLAHLPGAVLLNPLTEPAEIVWRQHVLADVLADPELVRTLFDLSGQALDSQHSVWMFSGRTADSTLSRSVHGLTALVPFLRRLHSLAARRLPSARSAGLAGLFARLVDDLDPAYLAAMEELLVQLQFPAGVLTRARLDRSGLLGSLELLAPGAGRRPWWAVFGLPPPGRLRFTIAERDEAGARALEELRDDAIHEVAATLSRSCDHVLDFFRQLRWETGFYVGCVALHERLSASGVPLCWPVPAADPVLVAQGLSCLSHAIRNGEPPEPNDVLDHRADLTVITGANQGGKTTFLRSVGCAQLLLQAGMTVPARSYRAGIAPAIHTHFRRAEDDDLASGKLEEELVRMSRIVDRCHRGDLLLMNESFASTDEVEGTYLAVDIIDALLAHGVRVLVVTHFHRLARHYRDRDGVVFLIAERLDDGRRTYCVRPGVPTSTSHGRDIYRQVFGPSPGRPGQSGAGPDSGRSSGPQESAAASAG
jgi:hypothetical protein